MMGRERRESLIFISFILYGHTFLHVFPVIYNGTLVQNGMNFHFKFFQKSKESKLKKKIHIFQLN